MNNNNTNTKNNTSKLSFPLDNLIKTGAHLGHHTDSRTPLATPYIFGIRKKIDIINLQETLINFLPISKIITKTIENRGTILFYAQNPSILPNLQQAAKIHKQPYLTGPWVPGTLTNFKSVSKSKHYQKNSTKFSSLKNLPNLIILLDKTPQPYLITEANKLLIPIISITDSNTNPHSIPYILPANDDSLPTINIFIKLFTQAILRGYANEIILFSS